MRKAIEAFDHLDILVNNAAYQMHVEAVEDLDLEQWRRTLDTNLTGMFQLTRAALPHLGMGAAIVNTGSVHAFTKTLAQMLVDRGIRVNCVSPGPVWTPLNPAERDPDSVRSFGADTPMGRPAQPDEIAPAFVYFASNVDSSYVTGEVLTLLGGDTRAG